MAMCPKQAASPGKKTNNIAPNERPPPPVYGRQTWARATLDAARLNTLFDGFRDDEKAIFLTRGVCQDFVLLVAIGHNVGADWQGIANHR